jgi:hypothetical protein
MPQLGRLTVSDDYLLYGLNALSRAHEFDYFADGHRGGAILSGVYLCRENDVEVGVADTIGSIIDERWSKTELCAPFPDEAPNPQLLDQVLRCMAQNLSGLRQVGHNVILPALALKAFRDLPEAITPSRVNGVCRLIESFTQTDVPMAEDFVLPNLENPIETSECILSEFIQCTQRFEGRGQGWSGHLLTYGRALIDLLQLGYSELVELAEQGFHIYIRRIRLGPQESDKQYREHAPTTLFPLMEAYWKQRGGDLNLGHKLKYPYGFYGLMRLAKNAEIKRQALSIAYRIF